jgi:tRNA(Ile)-lysidine synthase
MLPRGLRAERTARELRLTPGPAAGRKPAEGAPGAIPEYSVAIPGEIDAPAFGLRIRIEVSSRGVVEGNADGFSCHWGKTATLRNWKPGDRVRLRYAAGPRKVKEVLERMKVTGTERAIWPVLEIDGRIVWMRGVELEKEPSLVISAAFAGESGVDSPPQARAKHR